eukprot:gb/GFBE01071840.1/.p1 GENE.gb/GFBE01071840.1/~~gb/GFBE01071840.1/.p1  ORF type:complete len:259 (+),score=65.36 gb/GFBE01071840.1/:1-777(+)
MAAAYIANKKKGVQGPITGVDRRKRLAKRLQDDQIKAARIFDALDDSVSGVIDEKQLKSLLTKLNDNKKPSEEALSFAVEEVGRLQKGASSGLIRKPDGPPPPIQPLPSADEAKEDDKAPLIEPEAETAAATEQKTELQYYTRSAVLSAATRIRYYLSHANDVEDIFNKFDKNGSGCLDRQELQNALQYLEDRDGKREQYGILVQIPVSDEDVTWILAQCDVSGEGTINRAEAVPAMAMWHSLADEHFQQQSKCCTVQ